MIYPQIVQPRKLHLYKLFRRNQQINADTALLFLNSPVVLKKLKSFRAPNPGAGYAQGRYAVTL